MKTIDLIKTASSNMLRSKLRSILTILAIFIGAFTISLTIGISAGISSYIDKQLGNLGAEDVLIVQPRTEFSLIDSSEGPQEYNPEQTVSSAGQFGTSQVVLTDADIEIIKKTPGILSAEPNISVAPDYVEGPSGVKYKITVVSYVDGTNLDIAYGAMPNNKAKNNEIMVPLKYVEALGYSEMNVLESEVAIGTTDANGDEYLTKATVIGVQQESLVNSDGASINKALQDELYVAQSVGLPKIALDQYFVALARFDVELSDVEVNNIRAELGEKGYDSQTVTGQIGSFKDAINAVSYVLIFFGAIALLAATFGIINTLFMAVQERTKEIGLMKAVGMSSKKIFILFSIEAVLLGFWGSLLGVLAAIGLGRVANSYASQTFLKDLAGFDLTSFPLVSVAGIMIVIMIIAFFAGTLPARRAAKQNPIDALRYE
jgi:putative ABC transport system permease protein